MSAEDVTGAGDVNECWGCGCVLGVWMCNRCWGCACVLRVCNRCSAYVEAANAFKQCDTAAAVNAFDAAAQVPDCYPAAACMCLCVCAAAAVVCMYLCVCAACVLACVLVVCAGSVLPRMCCCRAGSVVLVVLWW